MSPSWRLILFASLWAYFLAAEDTCSASATKAAKTQAEIEAEEENEASELEVNLLQTAKIRVNAAAALVDDDEATPEGARDDQISAFADVSLMQVGPAELLEITNKGVDLPKRQISELGGACESDDECCKEDADSYCPHFCQAGTEIDMHSVKGWVMKGTCAKKWENYCTEDEQCEKGAICLRPVGKLSGTCRNDTLCDTMSCGRGHCRWGKCTCEYGVTGEKCDSSTEAFAFLFYGNSSENVVSVRVLVKSMRAGGAIQDIVAIVPKDMIKITPKTHLDVLKGDGVKIFYADPIPMPVSMDADPIIHKRWSGVMTKFAVWQMTEYTQVALVDTDMVFDIDAQSPGEIFKECLAPLCAVRDGDSRFMNAGVMVITPSKQRLAHIMKVLADEQHHFAMPEQSFLTQYCKNKKYRMKLQFLDKKWNSCVGGGMLHNIGWESTGYNVLHSCSWTVKPVNLKMCDPETCDSNQEWHTVLVWQFFHREVDSCIRHSDEGKCKAGGNNKCHWCGKYCSDARIECNAKLFNQTYVKDKDEPDLQQAASLGALARNAWDLPDTKKNDQVWHDLPQGSWAWPQVGMYQVLIDRFATDDTPEHCDKLNDYCGGTIPGLMQKVEYLEDMGVDGIILSPIVDQMPHGYHGYWTKDLNKVNPAYGTEDDVKEMVVLLHERKMKVIVDVNMNHAGGPGINASDPKDVSILKPFNKPEYYHSSNCSLIHDADYDKGSWYLEHCKLYGLPDYDHENPVVWQGLMDWVRSHVDKYGFDGIRVDAARHINRNFLNHIPANGPPIPAYYEVVNPEMSYVANYATGDYGAIYNYPLYFILKDIFVPGKKQKPMSDLGDWMVKEAPKAEGRLMLNFIDNNDLPRFLYRIGEGGGVAEATQIALYHNALVCVLGAEGLPALLFGSEQDARGRLNYSDTLKVDNWRQPLWHHGYNTSSSTFQLIKKVLWLRQRTNGLHQHQMIPVFQDHQVLVFARGPAIFVVTNAGQPSKIPSQRVLWDNATAGLGPYGSPTVVCNLLGAKPLEDCGVIAPGNISRIRLYNDPKLYVPREFIVEYEQHERWKKKQGALRKQAEASDPTVLPLTAWKEMPNPPKLDIKAQKRVARSWRPGDVTLNSNPSWVWHKFPQLPPHLDMWGPPLGMPVPTVVSARVEDACWFLGAGDKDGAVFANRGNQTYVLCPDSPEFCPRVINQQVNLTELKRKAASMNSTMNPDMLPVLHITFDVWYGVYHMLISALPSIAPHIQKLRDGKMKVFFHAGYKFVEPILSILGIADAVITPAHDPPLNESFSFCAPEMIFDLATRPYYPRFEFSVDYLHEFRKHMPATEAPTRKAQDIESTPGGHIVILSRGKSSRSLTNEDELVEELKKLGRTVEVVAPEPENFLHTVHALSKAEVLVGAHGANMANMIFAPEGVKVVEIVPQVPYKMQNYHFWDLAAALNFTYLPVGDKASFERFNDTLASDPMTEDKALLKMTADIPKVVDLVSALVN
eukprot:TRINITY_DN3066_c1_g3_i1.p1 TRINITY_DN3066_c1_g3~~TRINITY_DN3066_c1_g3_i1.p1  ORF type:complete len:1485 (+),score=281.53 TRINITY_DN3066_c1_g3_i1:270-4724(+)